MIFIFNLCIYLFFAWIMSYMAKKSYALNEDSNHMDGYEWGYIAFFTAICAFRWNTGVDCFAYTLRLIRGFEPEEGNTEYLYNGLTQFIAENHLPFSIGLGAMAFGQIFPLVKALQRDRYVLITLPYVLFGNCYFLSYMNGVRQMIVASMFVYACRYIKDRKVGYYLGFIVIGSLIHHSALMLLPLFALGYCHKIIASVGDRRLLLTGIYIGCVILGYTPSFQGLISYAEMFSEAAGYDNYTDRMGLFLSEGYSDEVHSFGLMMMSYFMVGLSIIWFGPFLKERYEDKIPCFNIWYCFAVAYGCLYFLVCNVSHVFIRPVQYFQPFQLIMASLLLWEFVSTPKFKNWAMAFVIIIWCECSWNLFKNQNENSSSNYHLVWFYDLSRYYR